MASRSPNEIFSLAGKTVLVTGASSGLGAHFARVLAAAGGSIAVGARRADRLQTLVGELRTAGHAALAINLDVTSADSVASALELVEKEFGIVDVLVNNAGVADSRYSLKVDEDSWDYVMNTNLKGAWRMARSVAERAVVAKAPCSIINIASILGHRVTWGESTYATSKAALVQLTRAMTVELARKQIRINALCPGYFATEMNGEYLASDAGKAQLSNSPCQRPGELHELDGPLLMLASEAGSFMNGASIPVDGGHLVSAL